MAIAITTPWNSKSDFDVIMPCPSIGCGSIRHLVSITGLHSHASFYSKRSTKHNPRSRERFTCHARSKVVEYEPNEKSGILDKDDLNPIKRLTSLPLVEFKMSDFELSPNVSIGLSGRGDEVVYEATVQNPDSPLKGSKVVLRQLAGLRAQRWRSHAMQVIKKLVRQAGLYQSYATQIYGYILPHGADKNVLTLVHGYYDDYSLHHWLLCDDWLPTLESRLALDEECNARRVGDHRIGGSTVSRQLRLIQILMRDLLIGVNYIHSHGFAHTELRLQNLQISESDQHIKVGLLGNASHFEVTEEHKSSKVGQKKVDRRQLMIAYDMRCVGIMMARMVLRELMDPSVFERFKAFLKEGNDPAGLREFLLPVLNKRPNVENIGLQMLDRNRGAGWNLLSLLLALKPSNRISCTEALRHRFLCGPKWRVESSVSMTRWSIGSAAVRIVEQYIYGQQQRNRLAQLVHVLELLNPNSSPENWQELLQGTWRLLYHTGKQIGLTWRQASPAALIHNVFHSYDISDGTLAMKSSVIFSTMNDKSDWELDKSGINGKLEVTCAKVNLQEGERKYTIELQSDAGNRDDYSVRLVEGFYGTGSTASPSTLPIVRVAMANIDMTVEIDYSGQDSSYPVRALQEVRVQIPPECFDISKIVCGTYIDGRLLILRGVSGEALLFVRSSFNQW